MSVRHLSTKRAGRRAAPKPACIPAEDRGAYPTEGHHV